MGYKGGDIYLNGRQREMIADAVIAQIHRLAQIKAELDGYGVSNDIAFTINNYNAILKHILE